MSCNLYLLGYFPRITYGYRECELHQVQGKMGKQHVDFFIILALD